MKIKKGDKIKILIDEADGAEVCAGDILSVVKVTNDGIAAKRGKGLIDWWFSLETMGEEWEKQ